MNIVKKVTFQDKNLVGILDDRVIITFINDKEELEDLQEPTNLTTDIYVKDMDKESQNLLTQLMSNLTNKLNE